jgi:hypothetical protein
MRNTAACAIRNGFVPGLVIAGRSGTGSLLNKLLVRVEFPHG